MTTHPSDRSHLGFTLLELLITLAIAVIIANLAVSNWQGLVEQTGANRIQSDLTQAFSEARGAAVHAGQITTLCPIDTEGNCVANWNDKVSLFRDPLNNKSLDDPDNLIRTFDFAEAGELRASNAGVAERRYFQYNPDGSTRGSIGHVIWCPNSNNPSRAVQMRLNFGGRVTWAIDRDGDGIREDANGNPLQC